MNTNLDEYDLILEEKEKELKKEKRNKIILGSSLALLLLLGSSAVAAPIISVAVDKNNSTNINNINIPSTLTFTNEDITKLIDGYKSEIQARKLSFNEFQTDFTNITKKYIVASNLSIGTIVQSAKITQNVDTNDFNIEIVLDENKEYLSNVELTPAKLNKNVLTIIFKENDKLLGEFFTPTDRIDNIKLKDLPNQIQNWIKDNQFTKEEFENTINVGTLKDKIEDWLGIDADLIGDIKYEEPKLIIVPKPPYTFVSDSNTGLIVDGNIEISNIKFYRIIKFINLDNLFNKLNEIVHSINGNNTKPEDFQKYLETHSIKDTIYNNLNVENNQTFNKSDILSIELNINDQLVVNLKSSEYLKYETEQNNNFIINNNELIIDNLDFYYEGNLSESDFIIKSRSINLDGQLIENYRCIYEPTNEVKNKTTIVFPSKIIINNEYDVFLENIFFNSIVESIDMSNLKQWAGMNIFLDEEFVSTNIVRLFSTSRDMFNLCSKLKNIILPENTRILSIKTFSDCTNLKTINLPNSLIEIDMRAFENTGLKSIVIPPNVIKLEEEIFWNTSIQWVNILSKITDISIDAFKNNINPITIYVPTQELKDYYDDLINKSQLINIQEVIVGEPPTN